MDLQVEKHQKAIRVLEAIKECEKRLSSHSKEIGKQYQKNLVWNIKRFNINTKIKERLQNYYNNNFKI